MKSLTEFILESMGNSEDFYNNILDLINKDKYDDIVKTLSETKKAKTFKGVTLNKIDNIAKFSTLFGFNEKSNAFVVAIFVPEIRGCRGIVYDGKSKKDISDWTCASWSALADKLANYKFKYFVVDEPNREIRKEFWGGLAETEKYD